MNDAQKTDAEAWRQRIVCDLRMRGGEPTIRGTRIPVSIIVGSLADWSIEKILEQYPQLTVEDVRAAIRYAAEASHNYLVTVA